MAKRFASLWFRHLLTDWLLVREPDLKDKVVVFTMPERGRKVVTAINKQASILGIVPGMPLADAKALVPDIHAVDEKPGREAKLLRGLGEWCIRYTPIAALDHPHGLILDISGCAHLWGGEYNYLKEIVTKLRSKGYDVRGAITDTPGAAWAIARYGKVKPIIERGKQHEALLPLPPAALRLETPVLERLNKLGLRTIESFAGMPRSVLRRRFGEHLLQRLSQALGETEEYIESIQAVEPYQERLPCLEPIRTATGIEIAIQQLLDNLCNRMSGDGKGLREAVLKCYRIDGQVVQQNIGTNKPSCNARHLFKLFELKIAAIEPALGIELFILEAFKTEDLLPGQEALWKTSTAVNIINDEVIGLLDRLRAKLGKDKIHRYLPDEHHLPERSIKEAETITEKPSANWKTDNPRPIQLLKRPQRIDVTAPIPDYPPMLFRYKGKVYSIVKSDGPERIEQEWWLQEGEHRDYYVLEDDNGQRYWVYRSGHYDSGPKQDWFIHGFFA